MDWGSFREWGLAALTVGGCVAAIVGVFWRYDKRFDKTEQKVSEVDSRQQRYETVRIPGCDSIHQQQALLMQRVVTLQEAQEQKLTSVDTKVDKILERFMNPPTDSGRRRG